MNSQMLEGVISFKYLGATLYKDGTCSAEIHTRTASAMARINRTAPSALQASSSCSNLFVTSILFGCETWTLLLDSEKKKKDPGFRGNLSASPTWSTRPTTACGARSSSLWVHRNLFWQLPGDGNLHGLGCMSNSTTASPKPSFRAPWKVGDTVVSRGNGGWTLSKSGHSCPCQNCSQWPPAEKTGRGSPVSYTHLRAHET